MLSLKLLSLCLQIQEKWALSNVGLFSEGRFRTLIQNEGVKVINTATPDLCQTSRQSLGSLRYYGLGLENRPYNVSLFFAEIVYEDRASRKWESLGRRVFDVYIQGTRRLKDFDISKEAVGDCLRACSSYGPLILALSVTPVLLGMAPKPKSFTYAELRSATKDFDPSSKLGEGGFGPVYKS
ncbi:hypothetical protein Patl1_11719 [Pistacia atlantica]|uniref:Uncharacterized protein n=1 Tax=Pistacia atlantica TaxID=434234 RepID=A0ACC1A0V6_9ROSI|nr:hypothetical protein Patl1_11719 [Pistacia atlantica]